MEKGLARFRVSLLCFCCSWFVAAACCCCFAAALLLLLCCAEVADSRRRSFPLRGPLPFSGANAACGCLPPQRCRYSNRVLVQCPVGLPMPPAAVCHLSTAGTPTASWSSAQSGCQCLLRLSTTSAPPELQPRPGPVPNRVANAACNCLPPQRRRHSNRVLVHCPFREPMPPCGCPPPQRRGNSNRVLVQCQSGCQCLLRLSATSAPRVLQRVLARGPCPQVLQRHPGVAKGTSIDPLARGPSTEPLLG